jgi:hypothetical protein
VTEIVRRTSRNVKHWSSDDMCLRWTAAGMLEAERQFRKIIGYKHLARLAVAVELHVSAERAAVTMPAATQPALRSRPSADHQAATAKFHGDRDILTPYGAAIHTRRITARDAETRSQVWSRAS